MALLTLAALAERRGFPRPAYGERAKRAERKQKLGPVRGRFHRLRLAARPPHPDLLHSPSQSIRAFTPVFAGFAVNARMACGEKETALRLGHVRNKPQSHNTSLEPHSVCVGGAGPIDYHAATNQRKERRRGPMLHGFLRTLVKVAVASLIVGTILAHFGITTEQLIREFGLSQDRIMELARQGLTWALPNLLLGSLVIVPVWFLIYLFRPPSSE
jgi:hypothetical protein